MLVSPRKTNRKKSQNTRHFYVNNEKEENEWISILKKNMHGINQYQF